MIDICHNAFLPDSFSQSFKMIIFYTRSGIKKHSFLTIKKSTANFSSINELNMTRKEYC
jgi:hypothetical protein